MVSPRIASVEAGPYDTGNYRELGLTVQLVDPPSSVLVADRTSTLRYAKTPPGAVHAGVSAMVGATQIRNRHRGVGLLGGAAS